MTCARPFSCHALTPTTSGVARKGFSVIDYICSYLFLFDFPHFIDACCLAASDIRMFQSCCLSENFTRSFWIDTPSEGSRYKSFEMNINCMHGYTRYYILLLLTELLKDLSTFEGSLTSGRHRTHLREYIRENEQMKEHPLFGVKRNLMKLIGNLCYKSKRCQDKARHWTSKPLAALKNSMHGS